jgi:hypothetical protein
VKIAVVSTALVATACAASNELTRAKAKELINERLKKIGSENCTFEIGKLYVGRYPNLEQALAAPDQFSRLRKFLVDNGLLEAKWLGLENGVAVVSFSLTGKAMPYKSGEFGKNVDMRVCDRQVHEVTGINADGSFAVAEYTWIPANPTPFAKGWREAFGTVSCDAGPQKDSAEFQRFDDGWRVRKD